MNEALWFAVHAAGFVLAFVSATLAIRLGLPRLRTGEGEAVKLPIPPGSPLLDWRGTGFWIGFFETFRVFVLVSESQYAALAVIFAAKEFVRKEKIAENAAYYLLGTLINLSAAVFFAIGASSVGRLVFCG